MYFGNNSNQPTQVVGGSKTKTLLATITSSQNWICPEGITSIDIFLVGGGAGGNSGGAGSQTAKAQNCGGAGGDGGKGLFVPNIEVVPNQQYSVVIGAGGQGGAAPTPSSGANQGNVGLAGGNTIFNNTYTANGGQQGVSPRQVYNNVGNGGRGGFTVSPPTYGGNIFPQFFLYVHTGESNQYGYADWKLHGDDFACINPYNFTMYGIGGSGGEGVGLNNKNTGNLSSYAVLNSARVPNGGSAHGDTPDNPPASAYGFGGNGGGASYGYTNKTIAGANGMSGVCFIYG